MRHENLYGSERVAPEAQLVYLALKKSAKASTCHPKAKKEWSSKTPMLGHGDVASEICKTIWGIDLSGNENWNQDAEFLTWWVYKSDLDFLRSAGSQKIGVHNSFYHPRYGEIDLTKCQFPIDIYLAPHPRPKLHERPITRSWNKEARVCKRKEKIMQVFIPAVTSLINEANISPTREMEKFLKRMSG